MKKTSMPVSGMTGNSLEEQALSRMNDGKYKEAIELYKKLLQDSDNREWRRQLAYCYLQRALAFAVKGMYKEALVLWENYSRQAQPPYEHYDHYLVWLIQTKDQARIQSCLGQLSAQQLDRQYPALAAILGLLILTGHPEFQQGLPQDSDFIAHLKSVQTALQAYRDNNPAGLDEALTQLPYRSAFRDLRTLLKAAIAVSVSPLEAQSLLAKIPAHSPYAQTAALLRACTRKGLALAREMIKFNAQQRRLIGEITGLNKKQLELIEHLSRQKDRWSDKQKFNLAIQYQSLCGPELARRFCFALLPRYPAGQRDFNKAFGPVDEFEQSRLKALASEREGDSYDAEHFWQQCIRALTKQGSGNALKIALILRHLAEREPDPEEKIQLLIESLEHDPDDRDSYLQILGHYSRSSEAADTYKQWLGKTLDKFPQDIDVLTLAAQTAMANKAYKKAGQYALKILKIDPLNTFAKQALFASHLEHARKLIKGKKYALAENEIQQAEALKTGKSDALQAELLRGLFWFAAQDKHEGLLRIHEALGKLNTDPINAHFQAAMEALLTNLPVATLLRDLPPAKDHLLSAQELNRLIERIKRHDQEAGNREPLHKALEKIKPALKKSLQQQAYDENQLLMLCETLDSIKHFELLRHCVKCVPFEWQRPIWSYYRIYAETNGDPERCSFLQGLSLQNNLERARLEKDPRAAVLIGHYLDRYRQTHPAMGLGFLDNLFGPDEQDDEDPLDELFGHLPDPIFHKLNKKLAALTQKTSPERLVQELDKVVGRDDKILYAMMQDPDLFTALMILRAADELGIDIDVSVEDVLECFEVGKNPGPSPF